MFAGLSVLDLTHVLAGPYAAYQLGLYGADVIKIEHPREVDQSRENGVDRVLDDAGMGTAFLTQGANKRALTLNLRTPEGRAILLRLVERADVLVENYRPGALAALRCGWDDLSALNPRLIYCSISAFGQTGPRAHQTAYDLVIQAASGLMALNGTAQTGPLRIGAPMIDYGTGLAATAAIAAALYHRERTGRGQHLDVAMIEVARQLMGSTATGYLHSGTTPTGGTGNRLPRATQGVFETADGLLMIAANNRRQQRRLWDVVGCPDLMSETAAAARETVDRDRAFLRRIFAAKTADQWEDILQRARVPAARVRTLGEALDDPQHKARPSFLPVGLPNPGEQDFRAPTGFFRSTEMEAAIRTPPKPAGADNDALLTELGYAPDAIRTLREGGVV